MTEYPMFDGPSPAAQEVATDAKPKAVNRFTVNEAAAAGRCICEGCRACRGKRDYPCSTMVNPDDVRSDGFCRHCRRDRAKAKREASRW